MGKFLDIISTLVLSTNKYKRPKKVSFFMPRSLLFARFTKHQRISCFDFSKIFHKLIQNSLLANKKGPFFIYKLANIPKKIIIAIKNKAIPLNIF